MGDMESEVGTLYLFHIEPPYHHASHYLGWTSAPQRRFKLHLAGKGSPLLKAALAAGHSVTVVAQWAGTRTDEARIKRMGSYGAMHCPLCRPAYLARVRARMEKVRSAV